MAITPDMFRDRASYNFYSQSDVHFISQSSIVPEKAASTFSRWTNLAAWGLVTDDVPWIWWRILGYRRKAFCDTISSDQAMNLLHSNVGRFHQISREDLIPDPHGISVGLAAISMCGSVATAFMPIGDSLDSNGRSACGDTDARDERFSREQQLREEAWDHYKTAGDHLGKAVDDACAFQPYAASKELAQAIKEKSEANRDWWDANEEMMKSAREQVEQSWEEHGGAPGGCTIS